jgi:hypothetical protein
MATYAVTVTLESEDGQAALEEGVRDALSLYGFGSVRVERVAAKRS